MTLVAVELQLSAYYRTSISISCSNYKLVPPTSFPDLCPRLLRKTSCWILRKMHLANVPHTRRSSTARVWPLAVRSSKANAAWISPVFAVETCREILSRLVKRERASALPNRLLSERVTIWVEKWVRVWERRLVRACIAFVLLSEHVFICFPLGWAAWRCIELCCPVPEPAQGVSMAIHCLQDALGCSSGDTLWLRFWAVMLLMLNFFWGTVKELKKKELEFKRINKERPIILTRYKYV